MSMDQVNATLKSAATDFYSHHKETGNYSAITYHIVESEIIKTKDSFDYKENANDEELVAGTFDHETHTTKETTIAIKKVGDHLVAEVNAITTTIETGTTTDQDETLIPINDTIVETKVYRMLHYTEVVEGEDQDRNILVYDYNKTINGEDVPEAQVRQYAKKTVDFSEEYSMEKYDKFVNESLIHITNEKITNYFFEYVEALIFYDSMVTTEQNGNQMKLTSGYNMISINNEDWGVVDITAYMNSCFKDGKIWKAGCNSSHIFENSSMERSITFDYTNEANVNMQVPEDLSVYTMNNEIWANGSNPDGSLRAELYNLPNLAIF